MQGNVPKESEGDVTPMPPATDTPKLDPSMWWRWSMYAVTALTVIPCGVILWAFIPPTVLFPIFALAAWLLVFLGVAWLVLLVIGLAKYRAWKPATVAVVLVLGTATLVALAVPSRAAFALSRGELTSMATDCNGSVHGDRVGLYSVLDTQPVTGGCLIYVEGGLIDSVGFAYFPEGAPSLGKPQRDGDIGYRKWADHWFTFTEAF